MNKKRIKLFNCITFYVAKCRGADITLGDNGKHDLCTWRMHDHIGHSRAIITLYIYMCVHCTKTKTIHDQSLCYLNQFRSPKELIQPCGGLNFQWNPIVS